MKWRTARHVRQVERALSSINAYGNGLIQLDGYDPADLPPAPAPFTFERVGERFTMWHAHLDGQPLHPNDVTPEQAAACIANRRALRAWAREVEKMRDRHHAIERRRQRLSYRRGETERRRQRDAFIDAVRRRL